MQFYYTGPDQLLHSAVHGDAERTLSLSNASLAYYSTDSEARHRQCIKHGDHNYDPELWNNTEISYKFNSLGFRTPELSEVISLTDPWFLALGCSYTVGVGISQSDRWSDQLSLLQNMPHINLAMAGAGLDYCVYQSRLWLRNLSERPDFVVVQHSEGVRQLWSEFTDFGVAVGSPPGGDRELDNQSQETWREHLQRFPVVLTQNFRLGQLTNILTEMWNSAGVPVYHWTFTEDGVNHMSDYAVAEFPTDYSASFKPDWGRDGYHDGPVTNLAQAQMMHQIISDNTDTAGNRRLHIPATPARSWWSRDGSQYRAWHDRSTRTQEQAKKQEIQAQRRGSDIIYR